jgi:ATP-dependent exoDNAse (exonuclease V) beta subunit
MMLDYLIGSAAIITNEADLPQVYSPLRTYYTDTKVRQTQPDLFYEALSNLIVLRAKLRDHQATFQDVLMLPDLITLVDMYAAADERMINTSPYNQQAEAVQIMTVFKAKGLEFEHVFLPSCQDNVWGGSSRTQSNHLTLPANLAPIRHTGASDDERLRILYVAATRAKFGLYLADTSQNYSGKATKPLKYFDERVQSDNSSKDMILPEGVQVVKRHDTTPPAIKLLELNWQQRHTMTPWQSELSALLANRLERYQLSPTHLNSFLDLEYGGPEHFFFTTLLRFPEAPTTDGQYGNAIHETLEWLQHSLVARGTMPATKETLSYFKARMENKALLPARIAVEVERGQTALTTYLKNRAIIFKPANQSEISFKNENVFVGDAHLAGKVDYLEIDSKSKTITVIDYKTGKSYDRWLSDTKLYRNKRQLCCYKIMVEKSTKFAGYKVPSGRLEFIEPDSHGRINNLELTFNHDDIVRNEQLLKVMWQHVQELNFPTVSQYGATLAGIRQFEQDLLDGKI